MENKDFAREFCQQIGMSMMGAFEMSGVSDWNVYVMQAEPMCNCVVHNIADMGKQLDLIQK